MYAQGYQQGTTQQKVIKRTSQQLKQLFGENRQTSNFFMLRENTKDAKVILNVMRANFVAP